jgi:hypothetical protein
VLYQLSYLAEADAAATSLAEAGDCNRWLDVLSNVVKLGYRGVEGKES